MSYIYSFNLIDMNQNFSSDKPVQNETHDRFQRYNFAKRIADTIKNRSSTDGIVIGIYGAWGEGKTSVLNFIDNELHDDSIITIKFNPWRYTDEETLIRSYLKKIADTLGKDLENKKEKLAGFITKYGSLGGLFGYDISDIGRPFLELDLENLKDRVDNFLKESNIKLVIFVDDIDRLDKQELYSLFRLVKLTADFQNTTYILSFDDTMVASAIGERFGDGKTEAGHNFLQKIIQVPLQIPKAQITALKKYCFDLVTIVINDNNLEITKKEIDEFVYQFTQNVLLRLETPRLAVRYANTLSFSIPLLKGEVNHIDLLLIEALKIFYPLHYEFVKYNSHYFTTSYKNHSSFIGEDIEKKKSEISEQLETLAQDLSPKEKSSILSLLKHLFPRLDEAFHNRFKYEAGKDEYIQKRIVSPHYFNRYFLYSIIDGEVSDVLFDKFIASITTLTVNEIKEEIQQFIKGSSTETFLFKANKFVFS
jgi:predicted KAP-like P-loop ATPase